MLMKKVLKFISVSRFIVLFFYIVFFFFFLFFIFFILYLKGSKVYAIVGPCICSNLGLVYGFIGKCTVFFFFGEKGNFIKLNRGQSLRATPVNIQSGIIKF